MSEGLLIAIFIWVMISFIMCLLAMEWMLDSKVWTIGHIILGLIALPITIIFFIFYICSIEIKRRD